MIRRIKRNISGARYERKPRRRGAPHAGGAWMRPPGSGAIEYQNRIRVSRVVTG